ncbi:hypothetical protein BHM03_00006849 [Ensete ventricosum]|nr:hypothetical protein BHM03_00006849 [Ensete ventricosum]
MALFFDFSIPFLERDSGGGGALSENKARKDARLRAVVRAMELGYAGVAYDRPFRGVLSDADRCKIAPFPLSSLLKAAPALAASAAFHRDLLGSTLASPFRQYTRLTISAHGAASAVALNGNALLRTYDLVALRPLNQDAFDKACESSEVRLSSSFVLSRPIEGEKGKKKKKRKRRKKEEEKKKTYRCPRPRTVAAGHPRAVVAGHPRAVVARFFSRVRGERLRRRVLVSPDDTATVLADSKESCQSFEISEHPKISDECMVSHTDPLPSATAASEASNYTSNDDLLLSNADQTSSGVMEKKPSNVLVEVQGSSDQFDNLVIETLNDAAEIVECIPDVAGDQMSLDDEGHFFADVMEKKDIAKIVEQEQKHHSDHCMTLQRCPIQPVSSNTGASLISSGEGSLSKGALKETTEQKEGVPFFKIDALVEKNITVVKDEIQESETKSGRGNHRERLSYPAYPLPFKSLFKPLLFQKKLCKPKRKRKHL